MMFLQPMALFAIPLIAIPIIIHWLNHRRHQPIHWGAMHFLKQAQKYNKGMAKLRYWLLLALRMAAVAGVLFAVSRPLRTGFLSSMAGSSQTSIVVLDRSPSMEAIDPATGLSKREVAIGKLDAMFSTLSPGKRILISSPDHPPLEIPKDVSLRDLLEVQSIDASSDIANLVSSAIAYANQNVTGPIDFWVCSDNRESDWSSESSRWEDVRDSISSLPVYRLNLLNLENPDVFNAALTVERVQRRESDHKSDHGAELVFDVRVVQTSGPLNARQIPLTFEIAGNRTTVELELSGRELFRSGVAIPIDSQLESGFGMASIPSDSNSADNDYRYVFAKPTTVEAIIVADDPQVAKLLQVTLDTSADSQVPVRSQIITDKDIESINWQRTAFIVWQSQLPSEASANRLERFVASGGVVLFLPPSLASDSNASAFETRWGEWEQSAEGEPQALADWRDDSDLLRNSATGSALPLSELRVSSYRSVTRGQAPLQTERSLIPLATLRNGKPLAARVPTQRGAVYFLSTLPLAEYSNLAEEGINWYIFMHRGLEAGIASTGRVRMFNAGQDVPDDIDAWTRLDPSEQVTLEFEGGLHAGVYEKSGQILAINRAVDEDDVTTIAPETLNKIFAGTNAHQVNDLTGNANPLASEIWQWFVVALVFCLMGEAWLTLPRVAKATNRSSTVRLFNSIPPTPASRI